MLFTRGIEIRHLHYVVAATAAGSFRKASKILNVNESAISRRIRDLEDRIGVVLFIRHHGGVQLTEAGRRFVALVRQGLSQIEYAASEAGSSGRGEIGSIRVGVFASLASGFLSELLEAFTQANSRIHIEIFEGGTSTHITALQRRDIDIAFLPASPVGADFEVVHLWDESVVLAIPLWHELATKTTITLNDLVPLHFIVSDTDPGPEIHDCLIKHLSDIGRTPSVERQAVKFDSLMRLIAMGQGVTLTSEAVVAVQFPGIAYRKVDVDLLHFFAVSLKGDNNPACRRLLKLAWSLKQSATESPISVPYSEVMQNASASQTRGPSR